MDSFFNPQPELLSQLLELRPLNPDDLEALYSVASAPEIWVGHPAKDRHRREVFEPYAPTLLDSGTALVVIDRQTEELLGCSSYYVSLDQPQSISIGFTFLHHSYWGGTTNLELKCLMLNHACETSDEVWFHIAPSNIRSQKATLKLGAQYGRCLHRPLWRLNSLDVLPTQSKDLGASKLPLGCRTQRQLEKNSNPTQTKMRSLSIWRTHDKAVLAPHTRSLNRHGTSRDCGLRLLEVQRQGRQAPEILKLQMRSHRPGTKRRDMKWVL